MSDLSNLDVLALSEDYQWYLQNLEKFETISDLSPKNSVPFKELFKDLDGCISLEEVLTKCDEIRHGLEKDVVMLLEEHLDELTEFSVDINYCEGTIGVIDDSLRKQYESLTLASKNICNLHQESVNINLGLENRKLTSDKLRKFVDDVIITPNLIKSLCNDPINETFIDKVNELLKKTQLMKKYRTNSYPSVESSSIQIKKLELVLMRRIYDFLSMEIDKFSLPKANIQLIQQTKFLNIKPLYLYLHQVSNHADDIRNQYVYVMRRTYGHLFGNYLSSLERCKLVDRYKTVNYIVKRCSMSNRPPEFLNYFNTNSRDEVVRNYNNDPILPAAMQPNSLNYEDLIKSFLKLLIDTSSTEFNFICKFFTVENVKGYVSRHTGSPLLPKVADGPAGEEEVVSGAIPSAIELKEKDKIVDDQRVVTLPPSGIHCKMYNDVFMGVLECLEVNMKMNLRGSYDAVGLILVYELFELNRGVLRQREMKLLEYQLKLLQDFVYERLTTVVREFSAVITKLAQQANTNTVITWLPSPFIVNTSHLLSSIIKTSERLNEDSEGKIYKIYHKLILLTEKCLLESFKKLNNTNKDHIYIIANYSILTHILPNSKHIPKTILDYLAISLDRYSSGLVSEYFSDIAGVASTHDTTPKRTLEMANLANQYRQIAEAFVGDYKNRIISVNNRISQTFPEQTVMTVVTKHVFNYFNDTYEKFYRIMTDVFNDTNTQLISKLPDPQMFKK